MSTQCVFSNETNCRYVMTYIVLLHNKTYQNYSELLISSILLRTVDFRRLQLLFWHHSRLSNGQLFQLFSGCHNQT